MNPQKESEKALKREAKAKATQPQRQAAANRKGDRQH